MSRPAARPPMPSRRPHGWAATLALGLAAVGGPARGEDPPAEKYAIDPDRFDFKFVRDDAPLVRVEDQNPQEFRVYNDVLLHARQFTADELERHANRDVTFHDLVAPVRRDFQYKLVYVEGWLKILRGLEPTKQLATAGVERMYEGWIVPKGGSDPICVLTTDLPPGLTPSAQPIRDAKLVAVGAYSFKLLRYDARDPAAPTDPDRKQVRRAPMLIGRSLTVLSDPSAGDAGSAWRGGFLPGMLAVVGGLSAAVLGLTWWFRRGDRAVRRELDDRRGRNPFGDAGGTPGLDADPVYRS